MDNQLLDQFQRRLLMELNPTTVRDYVSVIKRRVLDPNNSKHVKAWRKYIHFLFYTGKLTFEERERYLALLKTPYRKSDVTSWIDDETIKEYREKMTKTGYEQLYYLLLGGSRLKHILYMIRSWNPDEQLYHDFTYEPRLACFDSYCRYYLGIKSGTKKVEYIYFPIPPGWESRFDIDETYTNLKTKLRKLGIESKLFRKYVNQRLEQIAMKSNMRLDAVNFILSRELSVMGRHYLNIRDLADELFSKYVGYLREKELI